MYWDTEVKCAGYTGTQMMNWLVILEEKRFVHKCTGYIWTMWRNGLLILGDMINRLVILGQRG